jgi:hypothetical protein
MFPLYVATGLALSAEEAETAASAIARALCPPADVEQEVYVNTYNFGR